MMPKYGDGEMAFCSPTALERRGFEEGKVYAIRFGAELDHECTLKRVHLLNDGEIELRPDNDRYPNRIVKLDHIAHAALVVAVIRQDEEDV